MPVTGVGPKDTTENRTHKVSCLNGACYFNGQDSRINRQNKLQIESNAMEEIR